jgi:hypothetical protein
LISRQWKSLIQVAVVVMAAGAVLTVGGSLKGYHGVERLGEAMGVGGFVLFLIARIKVAFGRP